jgi:hypothetical protein
MRPTRAMVAMMACVGAMLFALPAMARSGTMVYEGKIEDSNRKAVSGVFPLSFSLHRSTRGGKSVWTESHFVAVDDGKYVVQLGSRRRIPEKLNVEKLFLAVSLTGGAEIVREKMQPQSRREVAQGDPGAAESVAPARPRPQGSKTVVDYAESAGLAFEAEHAKVADRVGRMTESELLEKIRSGGGKAKIGASKRYTSSAGGEGGITYELKCPKGHVVTGMRGGSGIYIDRVQLICSPLE